MCSAFEIGSGRHGCVRPLLGDGIFTQDGRKWEASRKLLAPMIQQPTLPDLKLFERHFQSFQAFIAPGAHGSAGHVVDMKGRLLDLSLKMVTEFLLGGVDLEESVPRATKWADEFAAEFDVALSWISKRERLKSFYWMVDGPEFRRSCKAAQMLVDELVCGAMELRKMEKPGTAPPETYVAFEPLLRQTRDPEPIQDHFMNLLLAGRDSCGSLLCWLFYALAREPELVAGLTEEMENIMGPDKSRQPDKKELNAMVKLDRFICESMFQMRSADIRQLTTFSTALRLFPPVPLNGRFSIRDTILPHGGGEHGQAPVLIPKGTLIAFSTFSVQRNRDLYGEDASKFRADRWDEESLKERRMVDWSYFPFLGGPRKCLGGEPNLACRDTSRLGVLTVLYYFQSDLLSHRRNT